LSREIIKLNGICNDLKNLTGVNFRYIPKVKEINLPPCSERKICKSKDFNKQIKLCADIEISEINKADKSNFRPCRFRCGLVEFILPIFNNRNLQGTVLTNKIKKKNNHSRLTYNNATNANFPSFNLKEITSLISILNYCHRHFKEAVSLEGDSSLNTRDKVFINRAKKYIEKNYHNSKLPLRDLAKEIKTSYFYLCRLFKRELNLNFIQYVTLVRLNAALRLLQNLNLTVAQVAYAVGFSDAQYFDRVFKRTLHCTPKEYRLSTILKREKIRQTVLSKLD
jgi:AraC-like DNA-binding protein